MGDFEDLIVHVRKANAAQVRPALLAAARSVALPHANLAQALAAVGGPCSKELLRGVVLHCLGDPTVLLEEESALHALSSAEALLKLTPSTRAAKLVVGRLQSEHSTVRAMSARTISDVLLREPTVSVQRILEAALPGLTRADPLTFVNALPILAWRRKSEMERRWRDELSSFDVEVRRVAASVVVKLPLQFGLKLALAAFRHESDLSVRLGLANGLVGALSTSELERLIEEGLRSTQRDQRLFAAELLVREPALAQKFLPRTDPDPEVNATLERLMKAQASFLRT
jgi:hypothetical protein